MRCKWVLLLAIAWCVGAASAQDTPSSSGATQGQPDNSQRPEVSSFTGNSNREGSGDPRQGDRQGNGDQSESREDETALDAGDVSTTVPRQPAPPSQRQWLERAGPDPGHYALVIGNERYRHYPDFANGAAAAEAMAEHLSANGYTLIGGEALVNASWSEIGKAVIQLKEVSHQGGIGVLYYAGHTYALGGENYLVATDTQRAHDSSFQASLFPLYTLWSFPSEHMPGALFTVLETNGMLGLFQSPLEGTGTGLALIYPPEKVVLAISDTIGPITLWPALSLQSGEPRSFWSRIFGSGETEIPPFTQRIIENRALVGGDPLAQLREVTLQIAETSLLRQRPAIVTTNLEPFNLEPFRDNFERAAEELASAPAPPAPDMADNAENSLSGVDLIRMFEGLRLEPYQDSARVATIGYGHTGNVTMQDAAITQDEAIALLNRDLEEARSAIENSVSVELNRNQREALTSFVFNVGAQAFRDSTLLEKINAGETAEAAGEMLRWIHVSRRGQMFESSGLAMRREAEAFLFIMPTEVDDAGRLIALFQPPRQPMSEIDLERIAKPSRRTELCQRCETEEIQELTLEAHEDIGRTVHALLERSLTPAQHLALSSFIGRQGLEQFYRSPVYRRLNSGDITGTASALAFGGQDFDQGVRIGAHVIRRRSAEAALFFASVSLPQGGEDEPAGSRSQASN